MGYWQLAGQRANERAAYVEAIAHLTRGLDLLKTLPDTAERVQHEIRLLVTLSASLVAAQGYIAPEVTATYDRALALCRQGAPIMVTLGPEFCGTVSTTRSPRGARPHRRVIARFIPDSSINLKRSTARSAVTA